MGLVSDDRSATRLSAGSVLLGCTLVVVSTVLPVMRWSVNDHHAAAGDARVWMDDDWTLADAGFGGTWLLPVSVGAAIALAGLTLLRSGVRRWRLQVGLGALVLYQPVWVAYAFARKLEDDVDPAFGLAVLLIGIAAIGAGLWFGRPTQLRDRTGEFTSSNPTVDGARSRPSDTKLA